MAPGAGPGRIDASAGHGREGMETTPENGVQVLVWGGGSGGVSAALQAARSGARTLLLTPGSWLGGMVSAAGVCAPDGNELSPWQTGLWGALLRALAVEEPSGLDHNWVSCFGYSPASAERILRRWLAAEPLLEWWPECRLGAIQRRGDRVVGVTVLRRSEPEASWQPHALAPQLLIDGSDLGDLIACCDDPFRLGWEPREHWDEPSAPSLERLERQPFFREQPVQSPTWVVMGQLAPSQGPVNDQPNLPPPFEAACQAFGLERTLSYGRLPGDRVMLNWPLHGNDWHHRLDRAFLSAASAGDGAAAEADLRQEMRQHSLRFLDALRDVSGGRLMAGAVFPDATQARSGAVEGQEALALMPYWREGRRLIGRALVREQDLLPRGDGARLAPLSQESSGCCTAIAVGNYANDHHYPGEDWPLAPKSCRWGGRWSGTPFTIPYGALVSAHTANLLAADKCIGVSHMANGATRLQPLILNIGQAAGLAAALCVRRNLDPAELPVLLLQQALVNDPQAPAAPLPLWDTPWHHPLWQERQHQALLEPSHLDGWGQLTPLPGRTTQPLDPQQAPVEPGERLWQGELRPDGSGGFQLATADRLWPLITLEPALHHWLQLQDRPRQVALIGCANPWGPWLRPSRLAQGPASSRS